MSLFNKKPQQTRADLNDNRQALIDALVKVSAFVGDSSELEINRFIFGLDTLAELLKKEPGNRYSIAGKKEVYYSKRLNCLVFDDYRKED